MLSVRAGPAIRWVGSVVVAMTGCKLRCGNARESRDDNNMNSRSVREALCQRPDSKRSPAQLVGGELKLLAPAKKSVLSSRLDHQSEIIDLLDSDLGRTYSWPLLFEEMFSGEKRDVAADAQAPHERWMREAIAAAREAELAGEVPVGTCVVIDGEQVVVAGNRTRTNCDPTAHAEIVALREAASKIGNYRLSSAVVYSTIEPCAMCAGALIQARVPLLVYGAPDEKAGAVESHFHLCAAPQLNHRIEVVKGVLEDECRALMQEFFKRRRTV